MRVDLKSVSLQSAAQMYSLSSQQEALLHILIESILDDMYRFIAMTVIKAHGLHEQAEREAGAELLHSFEFEERLMEYVTNNRRNKEAKDQSWWLDFEKRLRNDRRICDLAVRDSGHIQRYIIVVLSNFCRLGDILVFISPRQMEYWCCLSIASSCLQSHIEIHRR
jgi:hypothetical protein